MIFEKIEFLKQNEQDILALLQVRELDINSVGAQQKPKNYINPGSKSNKMQDKIAQAAENQLKQQLQRDNKK